MTPRDLAQTPASTRRTHVVLAAIFALTALPALWLTIVSAKWPLLHDGPLMHYVAWRLLNGAVPYRDLFDMNLPGTYLIHAVIYRLFGDSDAAWRLLDWCWCLATAGLLAWMCRPFGRWAAAFAGLFFYAFHLQMGPAQTGQRDFFVLPLVLLGVIGLDRHFRTDRAWAWLAGGGLAFGASLTIKPQLALLVALLWLALLVKNRRAPRTLGVATAVFSAGVALPLVVMIAWLVRVGAWPSFVQILTGYLLPFYSKLHGDPRGVLVEKFIRQVWMFAVAAPLLPLAFSGRNLFRSPVVLWLIGAGFGAVNYFLQNKGFVYHVYPLALFACPLAAVTVGAAFDAERRDKRGAVLLGLLLLSSYLGLLDWQARVKMDGLAEQRAVVRNLASDLATRVTDGDTVQVMDTTIGGIEALLRLKIRQPTRFIYDFHFFHDAAAPEIQALRREFVDALRAAPPRLIAVMHDTWLRSGYDRLDEFPELREILNETYALEVEHHGYRLYARR
jgi:hypothetical protein